MSNYEDLMKKILLEAIKKEKLVEKELAQFATKGNPIYNTDDLNDPDALKKSKKYFKNNNKFKERPTITDKFVSDAYAVAGYAQNPNYLDLKDLLVPYVKGDTDGQAKVVTILNQMKTGVEISKDNRLKDYFNTAKDSIEKIMSADSVDKKKEIYDAIISDFEGKVESPEGAGLDPFAVPQVASQVQSSAAFRVDGDNNKDFKNFDGIVQTSAGIAAMFEAVDGASLTKKLETLFNFGKSVKDKETIEKTMKDIDNNPQESFKFMNTAAAYLALIDLSKQYDGVSAGLAFEKYLAVLLNAPVIGGANGAADNIARTTDGSVVYMSAKSYQAGNLDNVGQSVTGPEGLANLIGPGLNADGTLGSDTSNKGESVFYITLAKKRKQIGKMVDMQYNVIDLYLTRVYYDFSKKAFYSEYLVAEDGGNEITPYAKHQLELIEDQKEGKTTSSVLLYKGDKTSLVPTYILEAPTGDDADMEMTQKFLVDQTKSITNVVVDAIKQAYTNSQKIEDGVRGYTAKKSSGKDALAFVDQLKKSYKELFSNLSGMFEEGSKVTGAGDEEKKQASDFTKSKVDIKESNQIVDIIREMVENELKNIDFE